MNTNTLYNPNATGKPRSFDYSLVPSRWVEKTFRELFPTKDMTVCIAAICGGDTVIGAADRMLTWGDEQTEPHTTKIHKLTKSIVLLTAGEIAPQTELMDKMKRLFPSESASSQSLEITVAEVAQAYAEECNHLRRREIKNKILSPLGLDPDTWMKKDSGLSQYVLESLWARISRVSLGVSIIAAGVDKYGPHIFVVDDDLEITCCDTIGFASIGSGSNHVLSQFIIALYHPKELLPEALLLTYIAKKRSEAAPGVGKATDLFLIGSGTPPDMPSITLFPPDMEKVLKLAEINGKIDSAQEQTFQRGREEIRKHFDDITNALKVMAEKEQAERSGKAK